MNRIKPRVPLDKSMLKKVNAFYKWNLGGRFLYRECFSHPALGLHQCNPLAKLPGSQDCDSCNHVPDRICQVTCHVNKFCLALFAFRVGVGGADLERALAKNLLVDYETLLRFVNEKIHGRKSVPPAAFEDHAVTEPAPGVAQDLTVIATEESERTKPKRPRRPASAVRVKLPARQKKVFPTRIKKIEQEVAENFTETPPPAPPVDVEERPRYAKQVEEPPKKATPKPKPKPKSKPKKAKRKAKPKSKAKAKSKRLAALQKEVETIKDDEGNDMVTLNDAAKLYDCSYHNMYVHVMQRKNIASKTISGKTYVRKEDVLAFAAARAK